MLPDALQSVAKLAEGFDAETWPWDLRGWGSDSPVFGELIAEVRPRLVIEVGTWKGASALHMANRCAGIGLDAAILCIDTWLGAYEFVGAGGERDLLPRHGWPQVYLQFLANAVRSGHGSRIYPFPQTSAIAARYLERHGVRADLIYLDGSHDEPDVPADIVAYRRLLRPGGVLFGDDYDCWPGVRAAVDAHVRNPEIRDGRYWIER